MLTINNYIEENNDDFQNMISSISKKVIKFKFNYDKLIYHEKVIMCTADLIADVNNGGFHQYYFNSYSNYAIEVPKYFNELGLKNISKIVKEANNIFGYKGPSTIRKQRQEQLDNLTKNENSKLSKLDNKFYRTKELNKYESIAMKYIQK